MHLLVLRLAGLQSVSAEEKSDGKLWLVIMMVDKAEIIDKFPGMKTPVHNKAEAVVRNS